MRGLALSFAAVALWGATHDIALAQEAVRFDRPIFTTEGTMLCARQEDIVALGRALEGSDRTRAESIIRRNCKQVGPDIRLTVVAMPGRYDPDVEVRVASAPDLDSSVPRGRMWTLKTMVRN